MFFRLWKQIASGKTLMRASMNCVLSSQTLSPGRVVDLGGGRNPSYLNFIQGAEGAQIENIDKQHGEGKAKEIDFETDALPYADSSIDQVLMLNVLEHIYNHAFFAREACRILKEGKTVIGFVPFLINYHADPHDYFRYTDEALKKIFATAGFSSVEITTVGGGPFAANFNNLASFLPWYLTAPLFPLYAALDALFLALKPALRKRFPLGYMFVLTK